MLGVVCLHGRHGALQDDGRCCIRAVGVWYGVATMRERESERKRERDRERSAGLALVCGLLGAVGVERSSLAG